MSDITEFILARVAEDEAYALRITPGRNPEGIHWRKDSLEFHGIHDRETTRHIVRHDPARVLRQCEAIRELVDDFNVLDADYKVSHVETAEGRRFQALVAMSRAASIWSDHPDYRDEWRP